MAIRGARAASVLDYTSGLTIRSATHEPDGDGGQVAAGVPELVHATLGTAAFASLGRPDLVEDLVVTAGNGYHLVHFAAGRSGTGLVLYVWLDRLSGNLALTQRRLRAVAGEYATC
jgi:hypothetical protein